MPADVASILHLEVPVIVLVGERSMTLKEITDLVPGSIIELPKSSDEELELRANNKPVGNGVAVKVGENFGIRLTFVGDVRERITALGSASIKKNEPKEKSAEDLAAEMLAGQI